MKIEAEKLPEEERLKPHVYNKFIDEEYENLSSLEKRLRRLDIMRALVSLKT